MSFDIIEVLKKYEWDYGFKHIKDQVWSAGKQEKVVDVEKKLGLFLFMRLSVDSPYWRVRLSLLGREKMVLLEETIAELLDEGEISAVPNYMWVSANKEKGIYTLRVVNVLPIPFRRLSLTIRNESGSDSKIRKLYVAWLEV